MNGPEQVQRTCMQLDPKQCSKTMVAWRYVVAPPGRQGRQGSQSRTIVAWRYVVAPPSSNSNSNNSGGGSSSSRCRLKLSYVFLRRRCLACLFVSLCATPEDADRPKKPHGGASQPAANAGKLFSSQKSGLSANETSWRRCSARRQCR